MNLIEVSPKGDALFGTFHLWFVDFIMLFVFSAFLDGWLQRLSIISTVHWQRVSRYLCMFVKFPRLIVAQLNFDRALPHSILICILSLLSPLLCLALLISLLLWFANRDIQCLVSARTPHRRQILHLRRLLPVLVGLFTWVILGIEGGVTRLTILSHLVFLF